MQLVRNHERFSDSVVSTRTKVNSMTIPVLTFIFNHTVDQCRIEEITKESVVSVNLMSMHVTTCIEVRIVISSSCVGVNELYMTCIYIERIERVTCFLLT